MEKIIKRKMILPSSAFLIIGIVLLATNLRAPITSVGPLVGLIQEKLMISNTIAGSLTTVPLLVLGIISPFAPKISRRFGIEKTVFFSLIVLVIGMFIRSAGTISMLFIGTFFIGIGIAVGNVLLPGLVKQNFAMRIGLMTGVYAVSMNISAAIASGISVPFASINGIGWQGALGIWALLTILAIMVWFPQLKNNKVMNKEHTQSTTMNLWKSSLAWKITIFMGLQSLIYYVIIAWVPVILQGQDMSATSAGWMISLLQAALLPFTFIVPIIAGRMKSQQLLVAAITFLFGIGVLGILIGPLSLVPLWMILLGIACGASFSLAMMFFTLRTKSTNTASELSGMAQSVGYLLAALGPIVAGVIKDVTGSWTISLVLLLVITLIVLIVGLGAGKPNFVEQPD